MWTTADEIDYIKRIGNHRETEELRTVGRKIELLRNYILAARLRVNWDGMDKDLILGVARRLVAKLEADMA